MHFEINKKNRSDIIKKRTLQQRKYKYFKYFSFSMMIIFSFVLMAYQYHTPRFIPVLIGGNVMFLLPYCISCYFACKKFGLVALEEDLYIQSDTLIYTRIHNSGETNYEKTLVKIPLFKVISISYDGKNEKLDFTGDFIAQYFKKKSNKRPSAAKYITQYTIHDYFEPNLREVLRKYWSTQNSYKRTQKEKMKSEKKC